MEASAQAQPNIALIKYWGKRDPDLNLPAVGSISVTLDTLWTRTKVSFPLAAKEDELLLNHKPAAPEQLGRVSACLDLLRAKAGVQDRALVESENNFPTAAGLASSASGFAALVVASAKALALELPSQQLCELARRGSGSAPRSLFGGFVEMSRGCLEDGSDAVAHQVLPRDRWQLEIVVALTTLSPKSVSSTAGMNRSQENSPFYDAWTSTSHADLEDARAAIASRDFDQLAALSEFSCLKMHAVAMSSRPGLIYWNAATLECLECVRRLRREGIPVFFTIDAGPQVKAISAPGYGRVVAEALGQLDGVQNVLSTGLGPGARICG